jgi:hypothetical protein
MLITKVANDDRNILCFEFDNDEWVAVNQHKWATEEQRRLIEEHPEFEGWDDDDLCDSDEDDEDEDETNYLFNMNLLKEALETADDKRRECLKKAIKQMEEMEFRRLSKWA